MYFCNLQEGKKIKANDKTSKAINFLFLQEGHSFQKKKTKPMNKLNILQVNLRLLGFKKPQTIIASFSSFSFYYPTHGEYLPP